jgi:hypothetical protein
MRIHLTLLGAAIVATLIAGTGTGTASAALRVDWMPGFHAPRTPARYDRVGVIKVGPSRAKNVLVLGAVGNGTASAAQRVLGLRATLGRRLPHRLLIYGFGAAIGGQPILNEAKQLARQSGIPPGNLTLINRPATYAHNDPIGAYPRNVFFDHLIPFLRKVSASGG